MFENINMVQVIGQFIGIIAMLFSIFSMQMNTHKKIMMMQIITAFLFAVHYLIIGGITACVLNAVAIIRNIIFYHKDKKIFQGNYITVIFCVIMTGFGIFSWNAWYSVFMVLGMFFNTLSFSFTNPQSTRKILLVSSPLTLIYNLLTLSVGGIINEVFAIISCITAFLRYRKNVDKI